MNQLKKIPTWFLAIALLLFVLLLMYSAIQGHPFYFWGKEFGFRSAPAPFGATYPSEQYFESPLPLGELPLDTNEVVLRNIPGQVPANATEILVLVHAHTGGANISTNGFLRVFSEKDGTLRNVI